MGELGKLLVFEGPDGVGKSTLARELASALALRGISCECRSFPGHRAGSLGWHIYKLHHEPGSFGIESMTPASLQLLHVSAHVDVIAGEILPALRAGHWIVLDRFWWSTWVYGVIASVSKKLLEAMIDVERVAWEGIVPNLAFLVRRSIPLGDAEPITRWFDIAAVYQDLALAERSHYPVHFLDNEGSIDQVVRHLIETLEGLRFRAGTLGPAATGRRGFRGRITSGHQRPQRDLFSATSETLDVNFKGSVQKAQSEKQQGPHLLSPMAPAKPSKVYETYWRFAAERQAIFFRRNEGVDPVTSDPILAKYKFTNAYRASDRVSQYLIRNVIYDHDQSPEEVFFRIILFKLFNKIDTWELLQRRLGTPAFSEYDVERYAGVLDEAISVGTRIYSAAYIMPSGSGPFNDSRKHRSHLKLLGRMMADRLALRVAECRSMKKAFELIRSYPMMGDFLAYQYITDLNYSTLCDFSEMEFVVPGPGAKDGIRKCFRSLGGFSEADLIRWVTDQQHQEFQRFGIVFRSLWGRDLHLIDSQNLFCEVDKYARLAHPDIKGVSGRTRIKQAYRHNALRINYWYPPKWAINTRIEKMAMRV
jgi:thymidylate kinase